MAPTKLVDGAWLYGLLQRWDDARFTALIQTYLEELGDGLPEKNHVVLYRKLLASQGCDDWRELDDEHFVQGAIQLALAEHAEQFLPEIIGFNLGYEQLPLHLLITSYELTELGVDLLLHPASLSTTPTTATRKPCKVCWMPGRRWATAPSSIAACAMAIASTTWAPAPSR